MDNEPMDLALAAAELSRHFAGALAMPQGGGVIATSTSYATYPTTEGFEHALEQEAAKGIAEADKAEYDPEAVTPLTPVEQRRLAAHSARIERARRRLDHRPKGDSQEDLEKKARQRLYSLIFSGVRKAKERESVEEKPARAAASRKPNPPPPVLPSGLDERMARQHHHAADQDAEHHRKVLHRRPQPPTF